MQLSKENAGIFIPDGTPMPDALARTTHLCIGAHPDDQEFMAYHGILECFGRKDKWFTGVCVTDGAGSARTGPYSSHTDEEMIGVRWNEQRKAASIGEYACEIQLGHRSAAVKDASQSDVADDIEAILDVAQPEVVYVHNPADKHDTHVASMLRATAALRRLPPENRPARVLGSELWRSLDWLNDSDKQVLPVDRRPNLAAALAGVFDSQISGGKRYDIAIEGRRRSNASFFESHAADKNASLTWAVDLTPLVKDDSLVVSDYIAAFIDRFRDDVMDRLSRLM